MTLSVKMAIYNGILARYPCFFSFTLFISICLFSAKVTYAFLADKKLQRNSLFKSENRSFTFINRLRFQWYRSGSICSAFSILQCSIYSTFSILQCSIYSTFSILQCNIYSTFSILQCSIYSTFSILQCSITLHFLYYNAALLYIFYTAKKHFLCIFYTIAIFAWRIT